MASSISNQRSPLTPLSYPIVESAQPAQISQEEPISHTQEEFNLQKQLYEEKERRLKSQEATTLVLHNAIVTLQENSKSLQQQIDIIKRAHTETKEKLEQKKQDILILEANLAKVQRQNIELEREIQHYRANNVQPKQAISQPLNGKNISFWRRLWANTTNTAVAAWRWCCDHSRLIESCISLICLGITCIFPPAFPACVFGAGAAIAFLEWATAKP